MFSMVALWNRPDHYIFMLWFVLSSSSSFFFPRLISAAADWTSTIRPHKDVNIEFFPNPDIECDNPVKIRISDFIRAA